MSCLQKRGRRKSSWLAPLLILCSKLTSYSIKQLRIPSTQSRVFKHISFRFRSSVLVFPVTLPGKADPQVSTGFFCLKCGCVYSQNLPRKKALDASLRDRLVHYSIPIVRFWWSENSPVSTERDIYEYDEHFLSTGFIYFDYDVESWP